ncbi:hypothetical protein ACIQTZ_21890 [Paenarthrobacter sp. NPDC090520]|uniref:hypothetical protein n=1 Tax=Paenarthrobacter sp. NPDC090520 TaxID=3364382 RepID=UPI003804F052
MANKATNIRINQKQVNASNKIVGNNRPDLQYDILDPADPTGKTFKHYVFELDRPLRKDGDESVRGLPHFMRILANDPSLSKAQQKILTEGYPQWMPLP